MRYTDYHVHTSHSPDCSVPMERQIEQAIHNGVEELCLTDHLELGFAKWSNREIDLDAYRADFERKKNKYPEISLRFGIEAGITCSEENVSRFDFLLRSQPFDFVIASVHAIEGTDPLEPDFHEDRTFAEACRVYITTLYTGLKRLDQSLYSCVGHIDFPLKGALYLGMAEAEFKYEYAADELDTLFRHLIQRGKCLEINTSSWARVPKQKIPDANWLKRYVELGGEYVTIGSDSHRPEQIGARFHDAVSLASAAGVRYLAVFEGMKPKYMRVR